MPGALIAFLTPLLGAGIATTVVNAAIGIGLSLISSLLAPKSPKPENGQGLIRQSVSVRQRIYGQWRVGGAIIFIEVLDGNLHMIVYHCQGPIYTYDDLTWLDNRPSNVDYVGGLYEAPFHPDKQIVKSTLGTFDQDAYSDLVAAFPSIYDETARCRLMATSYLFCKSVGPEEVSKTYPNRIPVLNRLIKGCLCYDMRLTAHDVNDPDTWDYTENLVLHLRDYLSHSDGMAIPQDLFDDKVWAVAASIADEVLEDKFGDPVYRYHGSLAYTLDAEPKDVIARFLAATAGRLYMTTDGLIGFQAGKWVAPTFTLDDDLDHIIHANFRDGAGPFGQANEVTVKFTHMEVGWKEATADPWRDEDDIADYGLKPMVAECYGIRKHNHARRIAKILFYKMNPAWVGTLTCTLHMLQGWDHRWIRIKYPDRLIDEDFEVVGNPVRNDDMTITIQVQSMPSLAFDFNAVEEEGVGPTVPDAIEEQDVPEPTGVDTDIETRLIGTITGEIYDPETDISTPTEQTVSVSVAVIRWAAAPREGLLPEAQYSTNAGVDWRGMAIASDGGREAETGPRANGDVVKLRVRFRTLGGAPSDWVDGPDVTI